jgi:hypothetical protein
MAAPIRRAFKSGEQTVYEWEQSIEEISIFIYPPDGVRARDLDIKITAQHLRVGIKGNPPFLDADLASAVSVANSLWTLGSINFSPHFTPHSSINCVNVFVADDGELLISLSKVQVGETWKSALRGHETLDAEEEDKDRKNAMLERFQREVNPCESQSQYFHTVFFSLLPEFMFPFILMVLLCQFT